MIASLRSLQFHPDSRPGPVDAIQVEIVRLPTGALRLTYRLSGDLGGLRIPAEESARRADGLWRHTCFEAFVRAVDAPAYREFNLSPSGLWQAYAFTDYRAGGLLKPAADPGIECRHEPNRLTLQATVQTADLPPGARLQIGLSAVIEASDGVIAYWALHHPPGKADFHHPDSFALEIDPP
ncbi:MAG: hypothetical protein B7Y41_05475 [Hydrogenophilales bacterium 28-61-23]|nr:MAG: hypothetical protein B7Y41_05475 [Hydrogenophilales bacterium 28-61-23]